MSKSYNKVMFILAIVLFTIVGQASAIERLNKVIDQPNAPLKITSYRARYIMAGQYTSERIEHLVEYRNVSERKIVAVKIGLVSFDVWNEFLDITGGVSIQDLNPNAIDKGIWIGSVYGAFSFLTGVAYIAKVRFDNGEIWSTDLDAIAEEIRKIEEEFDVSKLKRKKEE